MFTVYGPRPGRQVTFTLFVPDTPGTKGAEVRVTAKVPSQEDRDAIDAHLVATASLETAGDTVRVRAPRSSFRSYQHEAITRLVVRLDDYVLEDDTVPEDHPERRFEPHTPEEIVRYVDDGVKAAIVQVLMDRIRLSEAMRGKSAGRSASSTAVTRPPDGTAESVGGTGSAASARATALPIDPTSTSPKPA